MSETQPAQDHDDDEEETSDEAGDVEQANPVPVRSIYMSEKSSKSRQSVRQPRKDKGKTRMTAYMLWARSVRDQIKGDVDFATRSQRISEMWSNVSKTERMIWRRRVSHYNRKTAAEAQKQMQAANQSNQTVSKSRGASTSTTQGTVTARTATRTTETSRRNGRRGQVTQGNSSSPLDHANVAAHLKLLGDSLANIGMSLEQHERDGRQNSITGTVSVLLDSLLCSMVPLMCLTTQIEGFGHRVAHLKDTFQNTLDNIAYVMPGLPF